MRLHCEQPELDPKHAACEKIVAQLVKTRERILTESARRVSADPHLVHLAVNEAESLAWETSVPHLVFPALAAEKIQAVAAWGRHQETVWEKSHILALAI